MNKKSNLVPVEVIANKIFILRGKKVMLSSDLAQLYNVEVRVLVQAVKRNIERFPDDFMFQISDQEFKNLKSQIVISSWGGARRAKPYAFTEQGVAMLSSVLNSKMAIQVNIQIMRTFAKMRQMLLSYKELKVKIEKLESKYDKQFRIVFEALRRLLDPPERKTKRIGF